MKILSLHCDYIKFKPLKKAIKNPEELKSKEMVEVAEPLGIFTAVEKGDEVSLERAVSELVSSVEDLVGKTKAKAVVLYPYAHLSSNLATPDFALEVLIGAEKALKKKKIDVHRAPFGYYKEFELKCKGHPLAELSRNIVLDEQGEEWVELKGKKNKCHDLGKKEHEKLLKMMSKLNMQTLKGKAGKKTHIELAKDLDIYIINEIVGRGLPLFTPKGSTIIREIRRFTEDEELKRGYEHTKTPVMAKSDLYKVSGHWQHYRDDMFVLNVEDETLALRPMTCPFQFVLFKRKPRSYRDLPKKYAEYAELFRSEKSGELRGLTRTRQFALADGHIICAEEQVEEEFQKVLELIRYCMDKLGIDEKAIWYRFSKWDPKDKSNKYINNPKAWEKSQKMMKKILNKLKVKYVEADGEAAFYGPKLDLQYKDVHGKEDTLFTVQIDFALPERYDLTYTGKDNKQKMPFVIHRSSTGSDVRIVSFLLEHTQGNLPVWLSPIQARVISFTDRNTKASEKVLKSLQEAGVRADGDFRSTTVNEKVRNAELMKIPYIIVIGDKEEKAKTLAVRERGVKSVRFGVKLDKFVSEIKKEIEDRA